MILLFMGLGYLVMHFGKPLRFAIACSVLSTLSELRFGFELGLLCLNGGVVLACAGLTYLLVDRYQDEAFRPLFFLVAGSLLRVAWGIGFDLF